MTSPDAERFEIVCYLGPGRSRSNVPACQQGRVEAVRPALGGMTFSRFGGGYGECGLSSPPTDYYVIDEPDRAAFNDIIRSKGI